MLFSLAAAAGGPQGNQQHKGDNKGDNKEKLEAMRVGYLTTRMKLTSEEAQKFWPIYNEMRAELEKLDKPNNTGKAPESMTEAELRDLINRSLSNEEAKLALRRKYADKFLQVIPAIKVVRMQQAERDFKKVLLERIQQNHGAKSIPGGDNGNWSPIRYISFIYSA